MMRVYLCQICLSRNGARFSFPIGGERDNGLRSHEILLAVRHSDSLIGTQGHHHVHEAAMSVSEPVRSGMEHSSRRTVRGYEIELGALASI